MAERIDYFSVYVDSNTGKPWDVSQEAYDEAVRFNTCWFKRTTLEDGRQFVEPLSEPPEIQNEA